MTITEKLDFATLGLQGLRLSPHPRLQTSSRCRSSPVLWEAISTSGNNLTLMLYTMYHPQCADPGNSFGRQRSVGAADTRSYGGLAPDLQTWASCQYP